MASLWPGWPGDKKTEEAAATGPAWPGRGWPGPKLERKSKKTNGLHGLEGSWLARGQNWQVKPCKEFISRKLKVWHAIQLLALAGLLGAKNILF